MKQIQKDELYENLSHFLKGKGVDLKEGPYTKGIHAGCSMLADAINLSQTGLERARNEIGRKVDQVRQVIHERTAPKGSPPVTTEAPHNDVQSAHKRAPSGERHRKFRPNKKASHRRRSQ